MNRREMIKFSLMLTGTAATASVARAVMADVTAETPVNDGGFSSIQRKVVNLLAEMIIPETDTPGAVEAGVPRFIETIVYEWYTDTERKIFLDGLAELDALSMKGGVKSFAEASAELQNETLQALQAAAANYQSGGPGVSLLGFGASDDENTPFFSKLKQLTVLGYYTSEIGIKAELAYNPAPGRFDGDYPLAKVGRHWSY